ncbi:MAG: hypothetical protein AB7L84_07640 [Acidimicrobiia bacterium]
MRVLGVVRAVGRGALVVCWAALPVVALVRSTDADRAIHFNSVGPSWVTARPAGPVRSPVALSLVWQAEQRIYAPPWQGVVDRVDLNPGGVVRTLDRAISVDGVSRIAFRSDRPFARSLQAGDVGLDVVALHELLDALVMDHGRGEAFTAGTARGVAQLSQSLGLPPQQVFDPAWIVFLPSEELVLTSVDLYVGQPAPSVGVSFATAKGRLVAAQVVPRTDVSSGGGAGPVAGPPSVLPETAILEVAGKPISVAADRSTVSAEGLEQLRPLVAEAEWDVDAFAVSPATGTEVLVSAASVYSVADGRLCVLRRRADDPGTPVVVEVHSSQDGGSVVSGDVRPGDSVGLFVSGAQRRCP